MSSLVKPETRRKAKSPKRWEIPLSGGYRAPIGKHCRERDPEANQSATTMGNTREVGLINTAAAGDAAAEKVQRILDAGASANFTDRKGNSALIAAVNVGALRICEQLLAHGADPNIGGESRPLIDAAFWGHLDIARALLAAKAQPNDKKRPGAIDKGDTPLHCAAGRGHEAIVKELLYYKAEPESRDQFGLTPLSWASTENIAEQLITAGALAEDVTWVLPLSEDGMLGHNVERVRIEAKRGHNHVTKEQYFKLLAEWRKKNGIPQPDYDPDPFNKYEHLRGGGEDSKSGPQVAVVRRPKSKGIGFQFTSHNSTPLGRSSAHYKAVKGLR